MSNLQNDAASAVAKLYPKPVTRLELVTSPLPRVCSTTELHGQILSGGPGWIRTSVGIASGFTVRPH